MRKSWGSNGGGGRSRERYTCLGWWGDVSCRGCRAIIRAGSWGDERAEREERCVESRGDEVQRAQGNYMPITEDAGYSLAWLGCICVVRDVISMGCMRTIH